MPFLDPPVDVTPPTLGVYTDVDVSAHVSAQATMAIVRVKNGNISGPRRYSLRRNGASDDFYQYQWKSGHTWDFVPLDAGGVFEARLQVDSTSIELVGYFQGEANTPSAPVNVTPASSLSPISFKDVDIAAATDADTATAALLLFDGAFERVYARAKGGSSDLRAIMYYKQPFVSNVNDSEVLQAVGNSSVRLSLLGWLTDGVIMDAAPVNITPGTVDTWSTVALPAGATGAIIWVVKTAVSSDSEWGARKKGSGLDWLGQGSIYSGLAIVGADGAGEIEVYRGAEYSLYRLGYFVDGDDYVLAVNSSESASELSSFDISVGDYNLSIDPSESATELSSFDISTGFDASPDVVALVALPFDTSIEVAMEGPPVPAASAPATDFAFSSFGSEAAIYASDVGYDSQAVDDPQSMPFPARLQDTASFEVRAFEGDRPTGEARELLGALKLINADGRYDAAALLGWDGRSIDLWRGRKAQAFRDFNLLLRGTAERVNFDEATFTIALRDRQAILEQPINAALYDGSGGLNGHEGIVGLAKPFGLGRLLNVPAVNIDPVNLVYQVHDGAIQAIDEVRDKGIVLTFDADYADYDALIAASIDAGDYGTCLALGLLRLGGSPDGEVTVDFQGDASGDGYVETTAEVAERIVTTRLGGSNLSGSEVDSVAIAALAAAQPAPVGYWAGTQPVSCRQVLGALMGAIGGWHGFTRDGRFTVARLTVTGSTVETVTPREIAARQPASRVEVAPVWQIRVGWGRIWQVQSPDALAGTVGDDERAFYGQQSRYAVRQDSTIRGRHRLAASMTVESFFAEQSDADTEAARLLALYGTDRDIWSLGKAGRIGKRWLGELVSLDLDRYGHPKTCAVIGLREDVARGESSLVLWG